VLERSEFARGGSYEERQRALAGTVCISSDTGHAVHPDYAERHDPTHRPMANGGPKLKVNVNQRYATDGAGRGLFIAACERAGCRGRRSSPTTRSPPAPRSGRSPPARHGITTVDVVAVILSMHTVRELCGADPYLLASALRAFLGADCSGHGPCPVRARLCPSRGWPVTHL
jgi:aspartyl aminopeptidase